jgi:acetolactate synthase small subunit
MHVFHIRYRNPQGTLMRILTAATRRGIDVPYVQAEPAERDHKVTLLMDVNPKQVAQLSRDWYAIVDVVDVHSAIAVEDAAEFAHTRHLPTLGPSPAALTGEAPIQQARLA